jgi:hypothetical protein
MGEPIIAAAVAACVSIFVLLLSPMISQRYERKKFEQALLSEMKDNCRRLLSNKISIEEIIQEKDSVPINGRIISQMYLEIFKIDDNCLVFDTNVYSSIGFRVARNLSLVRSKFRNYNIKCDQLIRLSDQQDIQEFYRMLEWMSYESERVAMNVEEFIKSSFDSLWSSFDIRSGISKGGRQFFWEQLGSNEAVATTRKNMQGRK